MIFQNCVGLIERTMLRMGNVTQFRYASLPWIHGSDLLLTSISKK